MRRGSGQSHIGAGFAVFVVNAVRKRFGKRIIGINPEIFQKSRKEIQLSLKCQFKPEYIHIFPVARLEKIPLFAGNDRI